MDNILKITLPKLKLLGIFVLPKLKPGLAGAGVVLGNAEFVAVGALNIGAACAA